MGKPFVLLMAGGEGTRFAPLSTPECPKQFIPLIDARASLLQQSDARLGPFCGADRIWVTTNRRHVHLVREQLPKVAAEQIIGESVKKNTAPGIAKVAQLCHRLNPESILVVLPSDHYIAPPEDFLKTLEEAVAAATRHQKIVILGKVPTRPSTQLGYIDVTGQRAPVYPVKQFVEKPNLELAREYVAAGHYYWNLGMFIFPVALLLEEIEKYIPALHSALVETGVSSSESSLEAYFQRSPSISIDYGIMEKSDRLLMVPAKFSWHDLGTWEGLLEMIQTENLQIPRSVSRMLQEQLGAHKKN